MLVLGVSNVFRYLFEGLGVALAAYVISGQRYTLQEVALIGLSAAATLFVLDSFTPEVAAGARQGTGFGLGVQVSKLPVEGFSATSQTGGEGWETWGEGEEGGEGKWGGEEEEQEGDEEDGDSLLFKHRRCTKCTQ